MLKILLIATIFIHKVIGIGKIIPDDRTQYCNGPHLRQGEPAVGNFSEVDIDFLVSDDETTVIVNGTVTFTKHVKEISLRATGEQLLQGDWHLRIVKQMQDACFDLFNPLDIFYPFYKNQKRCPYKPGVSFFFILHFIKNNFYLHSRMVTFLKMLFLMFLTFICQQIIKDVGV
jgi:hypothetical protein